MGKSGKNGGAAAAQGGPKGAKGAKEPVKPKARKPTAAEKGEAKLQDLHLAAKGSWTKAHCDSIRRMLS